MWLRWGEQEAKRARCSWQLKQRLSFCADMGVLGCSLTATSSQIGKNIDWEKKPQTKNNNTQNTYLNECDAVLYKSIPSLLSWGERRSFNMPDIFPIICESKNASQIPMEHSNNCWSAEVGARGSVSKWSCSFEHPHHSANSTEASSTILLY